MGQKMGQKCVLFFKSDCGPFGMLKQVFLAHFEPGLTRFGHWKIPKSLENGPFSDQKRVKNGYKTRFFKSDPGPFGMLKQVFLAHFELVVTRLGPWKIPKCLRKGAALGAKLGEKWVRRVFPKVIMDHRGCTNK